MANALTTPLSFTRKPPRRPPASPRSSSRWPPRWNRALKDRRAVISLDAVTFLARLNSRHCENRKPGSSVHAACHLQQRRSRAGRTIRSAIHGRNRLPGTRARPFTLAARSQTYRATKELPCTQAEDCGLTIKQAALAACKNRGTAIDRAPTRAVRARTAAYIGALARCCSDLGGDILVFGSPAQRRIPEICHAQATEFAARYAEASHAGSTRRRVRFCL